MKIEILTLFPRMFQGILGDSMLKRAQTRGIVKIDVHDLRDWTSDAHRTADDTPYGGGPGMVMKIEPVYKALRDILKGRTAQRPHPVTRRKPRQASQTRVILLTPQGKCLGQRLAREFSRTEHLVLICGHYEGFDERIRSLVTDEISIGDYVLTCGEIPAMVVLDTVVRLIPGVLGDERSVDEESFKNNLLEYPHYTRPRVFRGMQVPDVLLSGDHEAIRTWRFQQALKRTKQRRPDLLQT